MKKMFLILPLLVAACTVKIDASEEFSLQLLDAAKNWDLESVENAIKNGADINFQNKDGNTALMYAAKVGHEDIVALLINKGANLNLKNDYRFTSLMFAVLSGHENIVTLLVQAGAYLNLRQIFGETALTLAQEKFKKEKDGVKKGKYKEIIDILEKAEKEAREAKEAASLTNIESTLIESLINPQKNNGN